MRLRRKRGPSKPFTHQEDCPIVKADPNYLPEWQEVEPGHWVAICQCGQEHHRELATDDRPRIDPYDPATSRHLPECEYVNETEPSVLRILLKVTPGLGPGYQWVTCGSCGGGWQVPHYAESVG